MDDIRERELVLFRWFSLTRQFCIFLSRDALRGI